MKNISQTIRPTCMGTVPQDKKEKRKNPRFAFFKISYQPKASTFAFASFYFFNGIGKIKRACSQPARASWTVACILTAFLTVDCFAQTGGNLYDRYKNYGEEYILKEQSQTFLPTLTPFGWIENPAVTGARQIIYSRQLSPAEEIYNNANKNPSAPKYEDPNKNNKNKNPINASNEKSDEDFMADYLNRVASVDNSVNSSGHYNSPEYKADLQNYQNAFNKLKDMLEGKTKTSIADALYAEEAAYGNLQMSYKEYKQNIAECAAFIHQWMLENNLDPKNPESVHLAIQKFMGDTLTIKNNNPDNIGGLKIPNSHKPYMYDYIDYTAEKDLNNYFLTKTLATGTGQCNTLPRVYLVLAEALGVEANLTFVHQHSFIKYKNNNGTIENYEPTVDWHMTDNDYTEDMPVMSSAITNGIYLTPLNKKQMVANLMIDLAYNFEREHWIADGKFMNQCINYGMNYFPNKVGHKEGLLMKNLILSTQLTKAMRKNNISNLNDIDKNEETSQAFKKFQESENQIQELGIQQMPEGAYNAMLQKHDSRGKLQMAKGIDTKSKKSLFFNLQTH